MAKLNIPKEILAAAKYRRLGGSGNRTQDADMAQTAGRPLVTQHTPPTRLPTAPTTPQTPSPSPPKALSAPPPPQPPRAAKRPVQPPRRPKPRKRPRARLPCNTWRRFLAYHTDDPQSIARSEERRLAAVRLSRAARDEIAPEQAFRLPACNYTARIDYAQIATDHITRFTASLPRSTPVFWITLIRDSYTLPYDEAADLNLFKLQQWVRAELREASFIGMTEAALYTNADAVRPGWRRAISWHPHLLVWGISEQRMREIRDSLNVRFRTLIPGVRAAHFRPLEPERVEGQVLYMLKAPVNEYRIITKAKPVTDPETGDLTREPTGRFKSKKYQLGPGELVRMANLLAGKTLDGLAFAGGDGKGILDAINFEARAGYRAFIARERDREASQRSLAMAKLRGRRR